jgi:Lar family restriction alleviation protein
MEVIVKEKDLKPCPFCGGKAKFARLGTRYQSCVTYCEDCGCTIENSESGHTCGMQWNTRKESWIAVGHELPPDHRRVLGITSKGIILFAQWWALIGPHGEWRNHRDDEIITVTHWMPLPEAPRMSK